MEKVAYHQLPKRSSRRWMVVGTCPFCGGGPVFATIRPTTLEFTCTEYWCREGFVLYRRTGRVDRERGDGRLRRWAEKSGYIPVSSTEEAEELFRKEVL